MPEPIEQASKPLRTWRPMAAWTAAILLALGLAWFVGAVVVPYFQVRAAVERVRASVMSMSTIDVDAEVKKLGGPEEAVAKCGFYLRLPAKLSPNKWGVARILDSCGSPAVPVLIAALKDSEGGVRGNAASALGKLQDPRAVEPLIAALKDPDQYVRSNAAEALGKLQDPRAIGPLMAASEDPDNGDVGSCAGQALNGMRVEPLIAALGDSSVRVRAYAAYALGRRQDARAVEPLITTLTDANAEVRATAAEALGDLKDQRAVEPMVAALKDSERYVRCCAATALGQLQNLRAVEPLIVALQDPSDTVRVWAARALGWLKDPRAVDPLNLALKDSDVNVRTAAAEALKKIRGDARVFRVLTLNVQKGTPAGKIAADLAAAGADILCLQELDQGTKRSGEEDQPALLKRALDLNGVYVPSYRDDGGTTGMAILSRFPVEDAAPIKLAGSRDIGIRAAVKLPGGTVTVFSVHLSATYKLDMGHLAETREMRRRETARMIELVGQTKGPVILAGDLNCTLDPDLVPKFTEHLTDATTVVQATYPAKTPVTKIDYVFARGLEVVRSQAMPEGSSDHRAVLCELRLPE